MTTTAVDPTALPVVVYCLTCGRPLTRWDSKMRKRGAICQGRHEFELAVNDRKDDHDRPD